MFCTLTAVMLLPPYVDLQAAALIEKLGHERCRVREGATTALVDMVQSDEGHRLLQRLEAATKHSDVEVARRANRVLAAFFDVRPSGYPLLPWIDMLPTEVKERDTVIRDYRQRAQIGGSFYNAPPWHDYRYATALYAVDLLRSGQPRAQVRQMLDDMATQERRYKAAHRLPDDY